VSSPGFEFLFRNESWFRRKRGVAASALSRTERRRRDSVERVLAAATELFAERGFAETSMAAIAEAADVSVGTLYNLFENKDALYLELVRGEAQLFRDRLLPVLGAGGETARVLDRFIEKLFELFSEEAVAIRLYWRVSNQARVSFRASLGEPIRGLYDETVKAFARVIAAGATGDREIEARAYRAALCCQGLVGELFLLHINEPDNHPAEIILDEAKRNVRAITAPLVGASRNEDGAPASAAAPAKGV
jgi:AcrR family transcriptional regulator